MDSSVLLKNFYVFVKLNSFYFIRTKFLSTVSFAISKPYRCTDNNQRDTGNQRKVVRRAGRKAAGCTVVGHTVADCKVVRMADLQIRVDTTEN